MPLKNRNRALVSAHVAHGGRVSVFDFVKHPWVHPVPSASSGKMTKSLVLLVIEQHEAATAMCKRIPVHSVKP